MSEKSDKLRAMLAKEKERRIKLNNRIFKNRNCAFLFQKIYCEEVFYNVNILPTLFQSTAA